MAWWHARARMRWTGRGWVYTVSAPVHGKMQVVLTDNMRGSRTKIPAMLWEQAEQDAATASRVMQAGHRFDKSWSELVYGD